MTDHPTDEKNELEILYRSECLELLRSQHVGRIAFNVDDAPMVLPVNYILDGDRLLFRTSAGSKFGAAVAAEQVAFEIDGIDDDQRVGWSVVVTGRSEVLADEPELDRYELRRLRPWARAPKDHWVAVGLHVVSGRRIRTVAEENRLSS